MEWHEIFLFREYATRLRLTAIERLGHRINRARPEVCDLFTVRKKVETTMWRTPHQHWSASRAQDYKGHVGTWDVGQQT